jgi:propanol-preferring alcohol dehydrogenase
MKAMVLEGAGALLRLQELPQLVPEAHQLLIKVHACGVCRTDLHVVDGELPHPKLPLIPGHEIVGTVAQPGKDVHEFKGGDRVGVAWLAYTCRDCRFCRGDQENLCERALFTGYTVNGGYAEYVVANADYVFRVPEHGSDAELAPLMCAGLIGYRSYRMVPKDARRIGLYGFGAAAHILAQVAKFQRKEIYAFTRPGNAAGQAFARKLGADWAGGSDEQPPDKLDAAIIFAPVGALVPAALRAVDKGGVVICAGIHMSDIPAFPYNLLWEERVIRSVANLTRRDGGEFLEIARAAGIKTNVQTFSLESANDALYQLRSGKIEGAAVLKI